MGGVCTAVHVQLSRQQAPTPTERSVLVSGRTPPYFVVAVEQSCIRIYVGGKYCSRKNRGYGSYEKSQGIKTVHGWLSVSLTAACHCLDSTTLLGADLTPKGPYSVFVKPSLAYIQSLQLASAQQHPQHVPHPSLNHEELFFTWPQTPPRYNTAFHT
jgi:hypothetical protein